MKCDRCKREIKGTMHTLDILVGNYRERNKIESGTVETVANDYKLCGDCHESFLFHYNLWKISKAKEEAESRAAKEQCDRCVHGGTQTVRLDDIGSTAEDWSCAKLGAMTDADAELSNKGQCPYFQGAEL